MNRIKTKYFFLKYKNSNFRNIFNKNTLLYEKYNQLEGEKSYKYLYEYNYFNSDPALSDDQK
jgi:hypothetical protein